MIIVILLQTCKLTPNSNTWQLLVREGERSPAQAVFVDARTAHFGRHEHCPQRVRRWLKQAAVSVR